MLFESSSAIHEHLGLVDGLRDNSGVFPSSSGLSRTLWRLSGTPAAPLSAEATRAGGQGAVMLRFALPFFRVVSTAVPMPRNRTSLCLASGGHS